VPRFTFAKGILYSFQILTSHSRSELSARLTLTDRCCQLKHCLLVTAASSCCAVPDSRA